MKNQTNRIFFLILSSSFYTVYGVDEIEKAIINRDFYKIYKLHQTEKNKKDSKLRNRDVGYTAKELEYIRLIDKVIQEQESQAGTLKNKSASLRMFTGAGLGLFAIYKLFNDIFLSKSYQEQGFSSNTSDTAGTIAMASFSIYQLYLGLTNQDAKNGLSNAIAAKQVLQDYLKVKPLFPDILSEI